MANDKLDYVETGERQSVDCSPAHVEAPVYYAWTQINAEKSAELSALARNSPSAFVTYLALRANAGGENACICSARVLADCLSLTTRTIYSCIAELRNGGWLITLRSGYGTIYVLNGDVTWHSWGNGKYYCQLKANVVISLDEQSKEMQAAVLQEFFQGGKPEEVVVSNRAHCPFMRFIQMNDNYIGNLCGLTMECPTASAVLLYLVEHMDKHNSITCSYTEIEENTGICYRMLCEGMSVLKRYGYVVTLKRGGRGGAGTYAINHRIFWSGTYSALKRSAFPPSIGISGPRVDVMFGGLPLKKQKIPSAVWKNQVLKQAAREQTQKTS